MKILVVDDELVSRMKLQKILSGLGECDAVGGGKVAIAVFEKALKENEPFDLVTLDIVMPELDGTEALVELRDLETEFGIPEEEKAVIMMVTSHRDKDNIVTAISAGCDNYIVKPFDKKTVLEKLFSSRLKHRLLTAEKTSDNESTAKTAPGRTTSSPVEEVICGLKIGEVNLAPLAQTGSKFNAMFKKGIDNKAVADLLKQDVSVSVKLMKLANSPYYGNLSKTTTLEQVIGRLGLVATKQYVDGICNRVTYAENKNKYKKLLDSLSKHSLCCAIASEALSEALRLNSRVDMFTAGLLHDIGKWVLFQGISEFERMGRFKGKIDMDDLAPSINARHCDFGADILEKWNFSHEYVEIAMHHDDVEIAGNPSNELLVVHFANLLAKAMMQGAGKTPEMDVGNAGSARLLEITPDIIAEIVDRVNGRTGALDVSLD